MSVKGKSSVGGNESGLSIQVIPKRSRLRDLRYKVNALSVRQKLVLITCLVLVVLTLSAVAYKVLNKDPVKTVAPVSQTVDEAATDAALEKIQKDPSAIPSGKFHPEKGDYFRSGGNATDSTGSVQQ